jgi:hypothetical protein
LLFRSRQLELELGETPPTGFGLGKFIDLGAVRLLAESIQANQSFLTLRASMRQVVVLLDHGFGLRQHVD